MKHSRGYFYHPMITPQPKPKNDTACAIVVGLLVGALIYVMFVGWFI